MNPGIHPGNTGIVAYDSVADRTILFGGGSGDETWAYNLTSNTWRNMSTAIRPPARNDGAVAYDQMADLLILFGGRTTSALGVLLNDTWAYDFGMNVWTNRSVTVAPAARRGHAMVYDPGSDRIILNGGSVPTGTSPETWAYNVKSSAWVRRNATLGIAYHAMGYDPDVGLILAFGGRDAGLMTSSGTWSYEYGRDTWTAITPSYSPSPRMGSAWAYDARSARFILFGGRGTFFDFTDTWAFDVGTVAWTRLQWGKPLNYGVHGIAYDTKSDRVVLVEGAGCIDRTWVFDYENKSWTFVGVYTGLSSGPRKAMVYDSSLDRFICLDGRTVTYDFNANSWIDTFSNPPGELGGSGRSGFSMAYDSQSDRVIVTGGDSGSGQPNAETWVWDYGNRTWKSMRPAVSPPPRINAGVAYDVESDRIILFGGVDAGQRLLGDTWAYDYNSNTWTNLTPPSGPSARSSPAMAYDVQSDRVLLFGGGLIDMRPLMAETWAYDFNVNTWTNLTSTGGPSARTGPSMTYDSRSDRVLMFGGFGAYGFQDDTVWAYSLGTLPRTVPQPGPGLYIPYTLGVIAAAAVVGVLLIVLRRRRRFQRPPQTREIP
jgi:hypothetical protein